MTVALVDQCSDCGYAGVDFTCCFIIEPELNIYYICMNGTWKICRDGHIDCPKCPVTNDLVND